MVRLIYTLVYFFNVFLPVFLGADRQVFPYYQVKSG